MIGKRNTYEIFLWIFHLDGLHFIKTPRDTSATLNRARLNERKGNISIHVYCVVYIPHATGSDLSMCKDLDYQPKCVIVSCQYLCDSIRRWKLMPLKIEIERNENTFRKAIKEKYRSRHVCTTYEKRWSNSDPFSRK